MQPFADIPEIGALEARDQVLRIPGEQDVPITDRVRRLIDCTAMRRLNRVSQLGLVALVYPGATHSRFEHSLGVYRVCLLFLRRLSHDARFAGLLSSGQVSELIAASLLHDVGHWPFCHAIEDMNLPKIPSHEVLAERWILDSEISAILKQDWSIDPRDVISLLHGTGESAAAQIRQSILSGPIDVDKMDYLYRDSLHAGVPYGMNYDRQRLIGSLCVDEQGTGIALTEKGVTAAELMVFARYVMFREVYWHHTVRSATAMLQRAFYRSYRRLQLDKLFESSEADFVRIVSSHNATAAQEELWSGLFGPKRSTYKRLLQFSLLEHADLFNRMARQPYDNLVRVSEVFSQRLSSAAGIKLSPDQVLIDAPPVGLEVQFCVEVRSGSGEAQQLEAVSPVVHTLARTQFDNFVKRVRVFVHPQQIDAARRVNDPIEILAESLDQVQRV